MKPSRDMASQTRSSNVGAVVAVRGSVVDIRFDELLETLHGTFHHLRQSSIDEELFDVISGFEVLSVEER